MPTYAYRPHACKNYRKLPPLFTRKRDSKKECYIEEEKNINKNRACHMATANTTVKVRLLFTYCMYNTYIWLRNQTYTVASAPTVIGSVYMQRFRLFLGQCSAHTAVRIQYVRVCMHIVYNL